MPEKDIYAQSFTYENFIRTAFNCPRGMKNGADLCFMQNAMTMEQGKTYAKHLGSFEKQFEKVKNYTSKSLLKLAKTKAYSAEQEFFLQLNDQMENIETTAELMRTINLGMEKIVAFKK